MNLNAITDNKTFWQTIEPYFNEKGSVLDKIALSRNESVLTNEKEITNTMNNYFTKRLNLKLHTTSNTMDIEPFPQGFPQVLRIWQGFAQWGGSSKFDGGGLSQYMRGAWGA